MIGAYILIGCLSLIAVAFFDSDDDLLEIHKLVITCIFIVMLWPMLINLIVKDFKLQLYQNYNSNKYLYRMYGGQ